MKSFRDYLSELESPEPCVGDSVCIEIGFEDLIETYVAEILDDGVLVESDMKTLELLESCGCQFETIQRYGATGTGDVSGMGSAFGEDQSAGVLAQKELATDVTNPMPGVHEEVERETSPVERAILHRILMQHPSLLQRFGPVKVMQAAEEVADFVGDVDEIGSSDVSGWIRQVERALSDTENQVDEAEYQGHQVTLNKPTRGDVKKFKVYVKDPSTGNIKKVNFGHGGTSAKRAGQKTMKIKKSNPARRRSFRARHHCENPGPKTKARYWSCRAW